MPSLKEHLDKAERNERFCQFLDSRNSYYDWAIVGLFYEAVHFVEAYADAKSGIDHDYHSERANFMRKHPDTRKIFSEYMYLKDTSEDARYGSRDFSSSDYRETRERLVKVRSQIESALP